MSLKIKRLVVRIKTIDGGPFGLDIDLASGEGLFVLRLDNTHGKSTSLNSIAYALGMEKGIGATSRFPFTPVMNKTLEYQGKSHTVLSSEVFLHISNGKDDYTLRRTIFGSQGETDIIHVNKGGISSYSPTTSENLFINRANDSISEKGFYRWLSNFIGWRLPVVPKTDGGESVLYPSTIFPLLFVEQKRGWTGIQATLPYYFKIKDVRKRALEFIMNLGVHELLVKKQKLKTKRDNLNRYWNEWYIQLTNKAKLIRGEVVGLKSQPHKEFSAFTIEIQVNFEKQKVLLNELLEKQEVQLHQLVASRVKDAETEFDISAIKQDIQQKESKLIGLQDDYDDEQRKLQLINANIASIELRLTSLRDNKRKYEDLKKVNELNLFDGRGFNDGACPACEQPIAEALLPNIVQHDVMSAEESLDYLKNQVKTFSFILNNSKEELEKQQLVADRSMDDLFELKSEIRRLKASITDVSKTNMEESIRQEVRLEEQIKLLKEVKVFKEKVADELKKLHLEITRTDAAINKIPNDGLSREDRAKLLRLKDILIEHEKAYGFSSFSPNDLNISFDSYLPTLESYDLGFDTSASDGIRIIWGYLLSLLELSREYQINHPGLVIFDEPRQQDADPVSFSSLLEKAAQTSKFGQQVILATSEKSASLAEATKGMNFTLIDLTEGGEKIMRPLETKDLP